MDGAEAEAEAVGQELQTPPAVTAVVMGLQLLELVLLVHPVQHLVVAQEELVRQRQINRMPVVQAVQEAVGGLTVLPVIRGLNQMVRLLAQLLAVLAVALLQAIQILHGLRLELV